MGTSSTTVVLVGMMGAGKTTVGDCLATELGWDIWDSDAVLQQRFAQTGAAIERREGIGRLHQIEASLLNEALQLHKVVICPAASVVTDAEVRKALRAVYVAYLRAPVPLLVARVNSSGSGRPLLHGDVTQTLEQLTTEREVWFSQVADIVVDVSGRTPEDIAGVIAAAYRAQRVS